MYKPSNDPGYPKSFLQVTDTATEHGVWKSDDRFLLRNKDFAYFVLR